MPGVPYPVIHDVVRAIPAGRVTTYGAVARRAGGCTPRLVGYALASLPNDSDVPWHRVVNGRGTISLPGDAGLEQRKRLQLEAVEFDDEGRVDLARFGWGSEPAA